MRKLLLAVVIALSPAAAQAVPVTLGVDIAFPEIVGLHAGFWVDPKVNLDLRLTLATVDAGFTGHLPVGDLGGYRSDLLLNIMGGYVHNGVNDYRSPFRSARVFAGLGWGLCEILDLRAVLGLSAAQYSEDGWGVRPTGYILLGYVF